MPQFFDKKESKTVEQQLDELTRANPNNSPQKLKTLFGKAVDGQGGQELVIPSDEGVEIFQKNQEKRRKEAFSFYPLPEILSESDLEKFDTATLCKEAIFLGLCEDDMDDDYFDKPGVFKSSDHKVQLLRDMEKSVKDGFSLTCDRTQQKQFILELIDRPVLKLFMYLKLKGIHKTDAGGFKDNYDPVIPNRPYGVTWKHVTKEETKEESKEEIKHRAVLVKDRVEFMTILGKAPNRTVIPMSKEDKEKYGLDPTEIPSVKPEEFVAIETQGQEASDEFDRSLQEVREKMGLTEEKAPTP